MQKTTQILHSDREGASPHGELHVPVYRNIAYHYDRSADIEQVFQGNRKGYTYGRQNNPTVTALERKLSLLEDGVDSVVFATGMNAIGAMLFSLLKAGDHVVASRFLFGNTRSLFDSFARFGIDIDFVDATDAREVAKHLTPRTKLVFVETIANPRTQVADLAKIGALCKERKLLYVVDNTMTSSALFRPKSVHAGLIVHSLSKYIAGHGACLGGSLTDTGLFDWDNFENILDVYRQVPPAARGLLQIRKKGLRDLGGTISPDAANLIALGMESLALRMERISDNAMQLATFLYEHALVDSVHYPGLAHHAEHGVATQLFSGCSGLMSFELAAQVDMNRFIDGLECIACSSNLGDTRSLLIPVATTIFHEIGPQRRREMGIGEHLIRLSVGIEAIDDLCADVDRALRAAV